jgi:hypothetical protein
MPGLLTLLKDVANRQTYEGVQLHMVPRGIIYPIDFGGLGQIRFGEKEGSQFPLIRPANRFIINEDAPVGTDFVVVQVNPTWLEPGGYVTIGERETHQVDDVNEANIFLTDRLVSDYETGQFVYHYSNPIEVEGTYSEGQLVINVDSRWFLVRGDVLAIATNRSPYTTTFNEYQIIDLSLVSFVNDIYQYQVTLDAGIPTDLEDGTTIQLRAYPAYKSPIRNIPSTAGAVRRVAGPFLLDWVSAPLRNRMELDETQTVYLYNNGRKLLGSPRVVEKNDTVLANPIPAEQFLFWQKVNGSVNYDGDDERFVMTTNSKGRWRLKYECIPRIEVPSTFATGFIECVDPALLSNNEGFTLTDPDRSVLFEFQTNSGYVPTPSSAASGYIDVNSLPSDNQWINLNDGFDGNIVFEFQRTSGYSKTPGRYTVDVRGAVINTDVAVIIREFLESIGNFQITPSVVGSRVNLDHDQVSVKGNQLITHDPTLAAWTFSGMSGGTIGVKTLDVQSLTTDLEVAQLVSSSITSEDMEFDSSYPAVVPVVELSSTIPGPTANLPITTTVTAAGWAVYGMAGGSGGFKWNVSFKPSVDCLLRIRFYPNDWQDFNLTGGVDQSVEFKINADDEPIELIDMLIYTDPDSEILMGQWNISGARVGAIHYEYVARMIGDYNFASTTLFLKPLWHNLNELRAVHDIGAAMNNGYLRL